MRRKKQGRNKPAVPRTRQGMAVILVLGLLSLTLALSYALLRSQTITAQVQQNSQRNVSARLAAQTGLSVALRKMQEANWAGVDSPLSGQIDSRTSYAVSFATGDASLTAASASYAEYPFRVTVTSQGTATDPSNSNIVAKYTATAVVQLVRAKFNPPPSNWAALQNYTLYFWGNRTLSIDPAARIEGPVNLQGMLEIYPTTPTTTNSMQRYLGDLNAMRLAGLGDHRPFSGTISLSTSRVDSTTRNLLNNQLGLSTISLNSYNNTAPLTHPGDVTSYRLYAGGKSYSVPRLQNTYGSTMSNATLGPDPVTNPLGVFRSYGSLELGNNAQITGTLIASDGSPLDISGTGVLLQGLDLPALRGATTPVRLPTLLAAAAISVESVSRSQIEGAVVSWERILVELGNQTTEFSLRGRLITYDIDFERRSNWSTTALWWSLLLDSYDQVRNTYPYFPAYLQQFFSLNYQPKLAIKPPASTVSYQWQDWTQPIYVKGDADVGLKWDLISWSESP